jgi:hypothetical protein
MRLEFIMGETASEAIALLWDTWTCAAFRFETYFVNKLPEKLPMLPHVIEL